mmetsp:Transcript_11482/g.49017  ORF Transcript_11482/g.49017 Transcript_11482/m.49017 type:complete len:218 (-) Transcript_11482:4242-4895(-)
MDRRSDQQSEPRRFQIQRVKREPAVFGDLWAVHPFYRSERQRVCGFDPRIRRGVYEPARAEARRVRGPKRRKRRRGGKRTTRRRVRRVRRKLLLVAFGGDAGEVDAADAPAPPRYRADGCYSTVAVRAPEPTRAGPLAQPAVRRASRGRRGLRVVKHAAPPVARAEQSDGRRAFVPAGAEIAAEAVPRGQRVRGGGGVSDAAAGQHRRRGHDFERDR